MQTPSITMKERDDTQAELDRFGQDVAWFEAHQEEMLAKYPEHWVAVFNQKVVGADPDFDRLLDSLDKRRIPSERAFIERVTAKEELLILPA